MNINDEKYTYVSEIFNANLVEYFIYMISAMMYNQKSAFYERLKAAPPESCDRRKDERGDCLLAGGLKLRLLKEIAIIFLICIAGSAVSALIPVPTPASVVSMVLLFLCFILKILKPNQIRTTSGYLLDNMAFFFVPSGVEIMTVFDTVKSNVVGILVICLLSTVVTFAATAYTVIAVMKIQSGLKNRRLKRRES